ncbi:MAG: SH3 domain-containing protein [bacterium]|nr:SH3 domain-containing protein [bacterium]
MNNKILIIAGISLFLAGCTNNNPNAGIEVKSNPTAKIFVNDKEVGTTPYQSNKMTSGEYSIKLESEKGSWNSGKVRVNENTIFHINRELATNPDEQAGENVSLEKGKGITIVTTPLQVEISLDGQKQGNSPYLIPSVSTGVHEIELTKEGYQSRKIKVKAFDGYKIVVEAQLRSDSISSPEPSPTASASATPSVSPTATGKATATPRTTPTLKPSPTPRTSASPSASSSATLGEKTLTVLSTPTGWLRVRSKPGTDGEEIAKINTGEQYAYVEQLDTGWTQIILTNGTKGYVASKYVKIAR